MKAFSKTSFINNAISITKVLKIIYKCKKLRTLRVEIISSYLNFAYQFILVFMFFFF